MSKRETSSLPDELCKRVFQQSGKIVDVTAVATLLPKQGKTDFTGKKFICPNPLLSFGSHI